MIARPTSSRNRGFTLIELARRDRHHRGPHLAAPSGRPVRPEINLRGHDSHGAIRIPQYAGAIRTGHVNPKWPITVIAETPVIARLDGGRGFGQVVARRGMEMAIAKAKANGLSAVTLANTTHVGRLADYAEMAAREGLVGMLWVNAVFGLNVAPWGGAARRLGTNPHAIAVPGDGGPAMVLDFATSVVAEGKMRVKKNRKQQAPPGWFIDAEGKPAPTPRCSTAIRPARCSPPASTRATACRSRWSSSAASSRAPARPAPAPACSPTAR